MYPKAEAKIQFVTLAMYLNTLAKTKRLLAPPLVHRTQDLPAPHYHVLTLKNVHKVCK